MDKYVLPNLEGIKSMVHAIFNNENSAFLNSILMDFEMLQFGLEDFQMSPF